MVCSTKYEVVLDVRCPSQSSDLKALITADTHVTSPTLPCPSLFGAETENTVSCHRASLQSTKSAIISLNHAQ